MASIRQGTQQALLVVDVQVGVMAQAWDAARVIANVAEAVRKARSQRIPVIWVQHGDQDLVRDSAPWQWVPELVPGADEVLLHKGFNSSFEGTTLDSQLALLGVSHIVLAGAATNWCIRATAYAALERGYDLTLVKDAHTTESMELSSGESVDAQALVADLNAAMTWLSYPGRRNTAVSVQKLNFNA